MFAIRHARADDLGAIQSLLQECELPYEDLSAERLAHFIVIGQPPRVVGCVGLERFGADALLRSLAVHPLMRGDGFAERLLEMIEAYAQGMELGSLYLSAPSATSFFLRQGYQEVEWTSVPAPLKANRDFAHASIAAATCLRKPLA